MKENNPNSSLPIVKIYNRDDLQQAFAQLTQHSMILIHILTENFTVQHKLFHDMHVYVKDKEASLRYVTNGIYLVEAQMKE